MLLKLCHVTQVLALFLVDGINTVFEIIYIYICLIPHFGKSFYQRDFHSLMNDFFPGDAAYLEKTNWSTLFPSGSGFI
jgi:hypothetical protein